MNIKVLPLSLVAVVVCCPPGGWAQDVFDDSLALNRWNRQRIDARMKELESSTLPENEQLLFEEFRRVQRELASGQEWLATYQDRKERQGKFFSTFKDQVRQSISEIEGLDCTKFDARQVANSVGRLQRLGQQVYGSYPEGNRVDDPWTELDLSQRVIDKQTCDTIKKAVAAKKEEMLRFVDTLQKEAEVRLSKDEALAGVVRTMLEKMGKRQAELQEKLNSRSAQKQLGRDLWLVILAIGLLSLGAIIVVRFFEPWIQIEWVASGQVIQFVTVMILLTVLMALGLSRILTEQTLGTLLGGIGGYVLSQGVGRAVARELTRHMGPEQSRPPGQSGVGASLVSPSGGPASGADNSAHPPPDATPASGRSAVN